MAFPDQRLRVAVEAYVGGSWVDVRAAREVYAMSGITVRRGRQNESPRPAQGEANLTIKSPTGKWSARNPRSPYFREIGRNTPLRIALDRTIDTFEARTSVDSWGTASDGTAAWTLTGTASAFDVAAGAGTIAATTSKRVASLGTYGDCDVLAKIKASVLDTDLEMGITVRYNGTADAYSIVYSHGTTQMSLLINSAGGSSNSAFTGGSDIPTIVANTYYWFRVQCVGNFIRGKVWADGDDEPAAWMFYTFDGDVFRQGVPSATGQVGIMVRSVTAPAAIVSVDYFEVNDWRFHGEVPSWPPRWTSSGRDAHAPITASGLLRRLDGNTAKPLGSAMFRAVIDPSNLPAVVAYNPAEDGSGATQIAAGIDGLPEMTIVGTEARLGTGTSFAGSGPLVTMAASTSFNAKLPTTSDTGEFRFRMLCKFPVAGTIADNIPICEVGMSDESTRKFMLIYRSTGDLQLLAFDQQWNQVGDSGVIGFNLDGLRAMVGFQVVQNGANVDYQIATHKILDDNSEVGQAQSGTFNSINVGPPLWYAIAPSGGLTDAEVGHFTIVNDITALNNLAPGALTGWAGETGAARFRRLCDEEGIEGFVIGEDGDTPPMGPQLLDTLVNNLIAVEQLDGGQMFEPRQALALAYRCGHTLVNQVTAATLSYANREIFEPAPQPEDDDLLTRNDITVERAGGSSFRATQFEGPMSVNEPTHATDPGVGTYPEPYRVSAYDDGQLRDVAYWRKHLGTFDGYRWPTLTIKRAGLARKNKAALSAALAAIDVGDTYTLTDLPEWLPPDDEIVLVLGMTEVMNDFQHDITYAGLPGAPYRVTERIDSLGNTGDVTDHADAQVASTYTIGNTSLSVASNILPLWKTGAVDFDIMVAGVRLHVTNIAGAASPQTFTVDATPVNGITTPGGGTTIAAGEAVHIYPLPVRTLAGGLFSQPFLVSGADTPTTQWAENPAIGTGGLTSTTYVATAGGAPLIGVSFVASSNGTALLHFMAQVSNNGANRTYCSFTLKTGAVLDQGEQVLAADDSRAIMQLGTDARRLGKTLLLTGLEERQQYNVVLKYRVTAGTGTISRRMVIVKPDGAFGALPGELVPWDPNSEDDRQDASDTSTSTSYTTTDMTTCGTAFIAPASGRVLVHIGALLDNNGANTTFLSFEVRQGDVVGSGTVVQAAIDNNSISWLNVNEADFGRSFVISGLTPGDDYNVRLMHKTSAGTLTLQYRTVVVEPTT